ncbi:MAG: hypothetical protein HYY18_10990 [Planctomycetes bacterium]|nr:hypothetical protein [Planctomycetota bacterium]
MKPGFALAFLLAACTPPAMHAKITMTISVRVTANAEPGTVTVNGQNKGAAPVEFDALALPFDPALKPAAWPPKGAQVFSPTVAQHGKEESSLALAILGDVLYVRTLVHGTETLGAVRLKVTGADGTSFDFDNAEKEVNSNLGRAEHAVRIRYKRRK